MKIGIIGSGMVGQSLAKGFVGSGHEVMMGTRSPQKLDAFVKTVNVLVGSMAEAAAFGKLLVLATKWEGTEAAIELAGEKNFEGKTVIDVTNPLKFEQENQPPTLDVGFPASAGMMVQHWLPQAHVVKAFNSVPAAYMVSPNLSEGHPDLFICGNDSTAKQTVREIAQKWGWPVQDMGGIEQAYLLEALAMLWIRYGFLNNHWTHAFKLLQK
ncbi:MAG: NAD(P)-binding domain-containing protein [Candidatus Diapherotrites archaeon]|nr:NAD(P)-binding domain-containing protein [Candidatus Diapherotrites archaeon]